MSIQNKAYFFHFLESDKKAPVESSPDGPASDSEKASQIAQNQGSAMDTRKSQFLDSRIIWQDLSNIQNSLSENLANQIVSLANPNLEGTLKSTLISEYKNTVNSKIGERLEHKLRSAIDTDSLYEKPYNPMNFTQFFSDCTHDPKVCSQGGAFELSFGLGEEDNDGRYDEKLWVVVKRETVSFPSTAFTYPKTGGTGQSKA
ncbi:hypothetical protein V865_002158 [Kwoniella europaea PYCC6329]|uniref:Uncharacterized protein n=1 Tax=Kwoniella europaea PYCC6329 TaxID=1423913 RepID=A0AAX4KDK5_9TREE